MFADFALTRNEYVTPVRYTPATDFVVTFAPTLSTSGKLTPSVLRSIKKPVSNVLLSCHSNVMATSEAEDIVSTDGAAKESVEVAVFE